MDEQRTSSSNLASPPPLDPRRTTSHPQQQKQQRQHQQLEGQEQQQQKDRQQPQRKQEEQHQKEKKQHQQRKLQQEERENPRQEQRARQQQQQQPQGRGKKEFFQAGYKEANEGRAFASGAAAATPGSTRPSPLLHLESAVLPAPRPPSLAAAPPSEQRSDPLSVDEDFMSGLPEASSEAPAAEGVPSRGEEAGRGAHTAAPGAVAGGGTAAGGGAAAREGAAGGGAAAGGELGATGTAGETASVGVPMDVPGGRRPAEGSGEWRVSQREAARGAPGAQAEATAGREAAATAAGRTPAAPATRNAAAAAETAAREAAAAGDATGAAAQAAATPAAGEVERPGGDGKQQRGEAARIAGLPSDHAVKSVMHTPHAPQEEERHRDLEEGTAGQQQQHYSTDDSVMSEGVPQHEEATAAWQHGEEAAAVAAAAAAVEEGVEQQLVAAAERTTAGSVKSRGRGSPRLRLFIMRQRSEGGGSAKEAATRSAAAVAAALDAAAAAGESEAAAAAELLRTGQATGAGGTAGAGGEVGCGNGTSREVRDEHAAETDTRNTLEERKLLLAEAAAAGAFAGVAAAATRPRSTHHRHLLVHAEDDEEEEERKAAPDESTCSNKAWSRRRNSKQELMSISAADRDKLLLDTGHSLEEVEERWWKAYFGDGEDMQRTRTRIAARRERLEKKLLQEVQQEEEEELPQQQREPQPGSRQQQGQQQVVAPQQQRPEEEEDMRGEEQRGERRKGEPATEQQRQTEGTGWASHGGGEKATQQQGDIEEEQRRRRWEGGLLTLQNWWEEVVETETGSSYVAAAGIEDGGGGADASRVRLSYTEVDRCANAVALWAVVTAAGLRRCGTGSTTLRGSSVGGSRGSSWSSTAGGPLAVDSSFTEQQLHTTQHQQEAGTKKAAEEQQLPLDEAGAETFTHSSPVSRGGSEASASHLLSSGRAGAPLQPHDVVVLLLCHPLECLLLVLGLLKANLIPALVPTHLRGEALEEAVRAAGPAYIISDQENFENLCAAVRSGSSRSGRTAGKSDSSKRVDSGSHRSGSTKDRRTVPAVGTTFFSGGGEAGGGAQPAAASEDPAVAAASACAACFGCPTSVYYYAPPAAGRDSRSGDTATAAAAGGKCLLDEIDEVLALCGVTCETGSSSRSKETRSREAAGLSCDVVLPPQCPPLREVLQLSAAARLACRGNVPCMECLRRGAAAAIATAGATKLAPGTARLLQSALEAEESVGCPPAATAAGCAVAPSRDAAAAATGGADLGRSSARRSSTAACVYGGGSFAAAGAASCEGSEWGALHAAAYFYATVPVARRISSSRWRRVAAAEQADAEATAGTIERGVGGREAEAEAEEVEKSLQPALLSHETLISIGIAWRRRMQLDVGDVVYCPAPLQAENGCLPAVLAALEARASLVFPRAFDAGCFWPHIDRFRCTYTTYFPHMWGQLFASGDSAAHPGAAPRRPAPEQQAQQDPTQEKEQQERDTEKERRPKQAQQQEQQQQEAKERPRRRLRGCAGEGMTAEWWRRVQHEAGATMRDFVEYHFRPHWPVSSPLINFNKKMLACGFVPNSVQGKRATARLVRYDQRRRSILRRPDSGRCFDAELRSKQEFRTGEAIVRLEKRHKWLGFANAEVTRSLLLENAFSSGDVWCRSGDLMNVDRLGFFYFIETLG